jgi:hypothetical protein
VALAAALGLVVFFTIAMVSQDPIRAMVALLVYDCAEERGEGLTFEIDPSLTAGVESP